MIKGVLFDFGQTLVDSSDGFRLAEKDAQIQIFENLALTSWPEFLEYYRGLRQDFHHSSNFSRKALWESLYLHYHRKGEEDFLLEAERIYWETVKRYTMIFPETFDVLQKLSKDYKLGLITNTQGQVSDARHRISLFPDLERFFDVVIVAGEEGIPPKPHSSPFLLCLSKMELAPSEVVFVGDDWRIDIRGAEDAGIQPIWLKHHTVRRTWPDVKTSTPVITSLEALLTQLKIMG